jgi:hypothetical protein
MNINYQLHLRKLASIGIFVACLSGLSVQSAAEKKTVKEEATIPNIVENCSRQVTIADLIADPTAWQNKEVCFEGVFNSFSALALDYPPAMRSRKKYISLTLFRPNTKIPLGELKLAMDIKQAQNHSALPKAEEGDQVKIKGTVFAAALGEPWLDIKQIKIDKVQPAEDEEEADAFNEEI